MTAALGVPLAMPCHRRSVAELADPISRAPPCPDPTGRPRGANRGLHNWPVPRSVPVPGPTLLHSSMRQAGLGPAAEPSHSRVALLGKVSAWPAKSSLVSINKSFMPNDSLKSKITEHLSNIGSHNKIFQKETKEIYCPFYASLRNQTAALQRERGFHLPHMWHYYLRD
jgi:hypothetical protein